MQAKGKPVPAVFVMFHLSVKPISRSAGRSATAAAAYRAGVEIADERTGELHDYTRKRDIVHSEIIVPPGAPAWSEDRASLWNAAETAEKRKDARVARDYEVAIPKELTPKQGVELVRDFSQDLADRYGVAVDFNVHRDDPRKWDGSKKGYQGFHAHILTSTRKLGPGGFGDKADPELSDTKRKSLGLGDGASEVAKVRERWEVVANRHLERASQTQRIDRRSLKDQGIDREPTIHLGPYATGLERRGIKSDFGEINRRIEAAWLQGLAERRELAAVDASLIDTTGDLARAMQARDQVRAAAGAVREVAADGIAGVRARLEQRRQAAPPAQAPVDELAARLQAAAARQADRTGNDADRGVQPEPDPNPDEQRDRDVER